MERLKEAFKSIKTAQPPANLEGAILCRIKNLEEVKMRRHLMFSKIGSVFSVPAVLYVLAVFGRTIIQSEFWTMISLAFTDAGVVISNWQNFLYSAMETLPVLALAAILFPFTVLLACASSYLKLSHKNNFRHTHPGICV